MFFSGEYFGKFIVTTCISDIRTFISTNAAKSKYTFAEVKNHDICVTSHSEHLHGPLLKLYSSHSLTGIYVSTCIYGVICTTGALKIFVY